MDHVILDRVYGQDQQVFVKLVIGLDAVEVSLDKLVTEVQACMMSTFDSIGLRFGTDDQK